ncbi:MAG: DMT family transporter [Candidatus Aminicenantes bacterium]|nr:DMT family transporter [Candidatus Aminicenantes bacterium]
MKKREAAPTLPPRLALAIGILAVSSGSIFVRIAQEDAPSLTIAAFRLGLAALILLPVAWLRCRGELLELKASDWGWALASGFFLAIHFGTWITSLEYTSVASSVVLVSTSPLWVALAARVFLDEPLTPALLTGLLLALGGSIVISIAEARTGVSARPLLGNALALAGALAVSGYWLIGRHLRRHMSLIPYVTMVYGFAALTLLAAAMLLRQPLTGFKTSTYGWFLLLALISQLLGHSSFNWALAHLPAAYVAIATLGEPIGASILAFLFFGEVPSFLKMAAAALILAGILLALRQSPTKIKKTWP